MPIILKNNDKPCFQKLIYKLGNTINGEVSFDIVLLFWYLNDVRPKSTDSIPWSLI